MIQFLRGLSLVLLILASLFEINEDSLLLKRESLFVLSTLIVLVILFVDTITGFILALAIITLIVKMYNIKLPWVNDDKNAEKLIDYITPENLKDAQNNIVINDNQYEKEWKGIKGVYGEEVYGAQGLEILPGYSKE
jgi:hypothetical protein